MAHLLHIDSSARYENSVSRSMTAWFAENWRKQHPNGAYTYLDVAREPLPHFGSTEGDMERSAVPRADGANAAFVEANNAVRAADTVIIGVPMYNFNIPTPLRAWLDRVAIHSNFVNPVTGEVPLGKDKRIIVATARGGSYAKGTPRENFDFQAPYLKALFSMIGLDTNLVFVHTEMTLAGTVPQLAQFKEFGERSYAEARTSLAQLAAA